MNIIMKTETSNLKGTTNDGNTLLPTVPFNIWKRELRKQQLYYPALKFVKLNEDDLKHYHSEGYTPIDALNDMLTAC
jgi:hypothetical protein